MIMPGILVPHKLHAMVSLDAVSCVTQLDGLTIVNENRKEATCDMNMFGAKPKWADNLQVWG